VWSIKRRRHSEYTAELGKSETPTTFLRIFQEKDAEDRYKGKQENFDIYFSFVGTDCGSIWILLIHDTIQKCVFAIFQRVSYRNEPTYSAKTSYAM
jgi:hypothetical protein